MKVLRCYGVIRKPRTEKCRKCESLTFVLLLFSFRKLDGEKRRMKRASARNTRSWERPFPAFIEREFRPL